MAKNWITVHGDKEFKELMRLMPKQFENGVMREIARKGARVVVKKARTLVQIPGTLGSQIKKDISVANAKDKNAVQVALKGKTYPGKNGKERKVLPIARHFTQGFKQTNRKTKNNGYKGKVSHQYPDFIQDAGKSSESEVLKVMAKESDNVIKKHVARWQRKLRR